MKRYLWCAVFALPAFLGGWAQHFPVGIASVQDTARIVQLGVLSSLSASGVRGVQVSGLSSLSAGWLRGLQLSGVNNLAGGVERGVQAAALLNVSQGHMRGVQLAAYNYADTLSGVQLGAINIAPQRAGGWQVGIVNISHDTLGHKIGLFNVNPASKIDFLLFGGTESKFNVGLRIRNRSTYNIVSLGTHYMGLDKKFSGSLSYRLGQYFELSPRWSVSGDVGFAHVESFSSSGDDDDKRLYSLQARLGVNYALSERIGAFATVGYAHTRYYSHSRLYRQRLLLEAGLTLRHRRDLRRPQLKSLSGENSLSTGDSLLAPPPRKRPWLAAAEATFINVGVHCFDRFVLGKGYAKTTFRSCWDNITNGFVWDNDNFKTNLFMHPYHGNLYFNSARSNGLSFLESAPYALGGSLMWEMLGETEPPAINDLMATTMGGIAIGEVAHRISNLVLNDSKRGLGRLVREVVATVINPVKGFNRIVRGEAWRVRTSNYLYHDFERIPLNYSVSLGARYLADNHSLFRGEANPYLTLHLEYGHPLNDEGESHPYDYFDAEVSFGLSPNQPLVHSLHLLGRLWSTPMIERRGLKAEFGLYQHFNYYDSEPVKDGTKLTPYRISEAAALGPGVVLSVPQHGALRYFEQRLMLSGILLGGTKSDYYNVIDRDYNMGSGFSLKTRTLAELRNFGRFVLQANYYRIFTWKGYDQAKLQSGDPLYLNAQGDHGNAALLVVSPSFEIDLSNGWGLLVRGIYYGRHTHYSHHPDVSAHTFELKGGLFYRF